MAEQTAEVQVPKIDVDDEIYDGGELPTPRGPDGRFLSKAAIEAAEQAKVAEATPETPAEEPKSTPVPEATPKHPAWLVDQAKSLGWDDEEIAEMSFGLLSRRVTKELARLREERDQLLSRQVAAPAPVAQQAAPVKDPDEIDWGLNEDGTPLTEKDYAPPVAASIRRGHKQEQVIKSLEEKLGQVHQREQVRESKRAEALVDRAFAQLGPDYEAVFGKGEMAGLTAEGKLAEAQRRSMVYFTAGLPLLQNNQIDMSRVTPAQVAAAIHKAAKMAFDPKPQKVKEESKPEKNGKTNRLKGYTKEEWEEGSLPVPAVEKGDEPPSRAKAVKNLDLALNGTRSHDDYLSDPEMMEQFLD